MVDDHVTFADLKGVLTHVPAAPLRLRHARALPAELLPVHRAERRGATSRCVRCGAGGAAIPPAASARGAGWLEILGAGMIHPNVLRAGRLRSRARPGLRVRHGDRPAIAAAPRGATTCASSTRTTCASWGSSPSETRCAFPSPGSPSSWPSTAPPATLADRLDDGAGSRSRPSTRSGALDPLVRVGRARSRSSRIPTRNACRCAGVDVGGTAPVTVVSAAPGLARRAVVAVALPGATLAERDDGAGRGAPRGGVAAACCAPRASSASATMRRRCSSSRRRGRRARRSPSCRACATPCSSSR